MTKLSPAGSLDYSTYLGGSRWDGGSAIAVDSAGSAYVTGFAMSTNFPTVNASQATIGGGLEDAFVAKFNPAGSALVYSTYLGGSEDDCGEDIAVDPAGNAYVTGYTDSSNFPAANALQTSFGGRQNVFVASFNAAGSLDYSTYLGGTGSFTEYGQAVATDPSGDAYVAGQTASTNFPTTANALESSNPNSYGLAFVAEISLVPAASLISNTLSFGNQFVGTTSATQGVTLNSTGEGPLNIAGVTVSGDYALATTGTSCPYTDGLVATQSSCTIAVTFTPKAAGPCSGAVTITDNNNLVAGSTQTLNLRGTGTAPVAGLPPTPLTLSTQLVGTTSASGSPHTVSLSGTGQDFTLALSSGSSATATAAPGQSTSYSLSLLGQGGAYPGGDSSLHGRSRRVHLHSISQCGGPRQSCHPYHVSVTTTAASASAPHSRPPTAPRSPGLRALLMLWLMLAGATWAALRRKLPGVRRWQFAILPLTAGLLLTLGLAGCAGGGIPAAHNSGTPAGSYTLTVTGNTGSGASGLSHNVALTLNVS